ncbi:Aristolochene synthase in complex with 12,13 Difluorofarnesyl diphosphate [Xylaria bambusicola]|uniref:Aristolochene synthase in complex with 12,13 Difluorofarnesyl diphosphate n=1 Tax=Xylaria bambusicola TaxID=326684 RepID=UPI002007E3ED|nr:Aristolochene synthase in complex with 12,13 Difluorofarnesyl diphosphate [Xylaria bambusicola]KAI0516782.1 Aristolochene synthase in complex with 12,13 Difluorofarnesyl diphosphate [Xylaria bambusicola]
MSLMVEAARPVTAPVVRPKNLAPFIKRQIPASGLTAMCHPLTEKTIREVNDFFLEHWEFPSPKFRKRFEGDGMTRVTCFYVCKSLDDRLVLACRLITLLFLMDDVLEHLSLEEGKAYNKKAFSLFRGDIQPDRNVPFEWISYDLWQDLRACDKKLADEMLMPVYLFLESQTDPRRLKKMSFGEYLEYRETDVGKGVLSGLIRFTGAIHLSPEDLAIAEPVDRNCGRHMAVVNDIWSYEKEVHAANTLHEEGGALCSAVQILAEESNISVDSAKRVLYQLAREWEVEQEWLVQEALAKKDTPELREYLKRIEYQMSGNEIWSRSTDRYINPSAV